MCCLVLFKNTPLFFLKNFQQDYQKKRGRRGYTKKLTWAWKGWGSFRFIGSKHVAGRRLGSDPATVTDDGLKGGGGNGQGVCPPQIFTVPATGSSGLSSGPMQK